MGSMAIAMSKLIHLPVEHLRLDLRNPRTVPQTSEIEAIASMTTISPTYFWGLMESVLTNGFMGIELLLVLRTSKNDLGGVVKEGNRRLAVLKMALGLIDYTSLDIPSNLHTMLTEISSEWRAQNEQVPCMVYDTGEEETVETLVDRAHANSQTAGRDVWEAIAKARRNRNKGGSEPGLELLEKFLNSSKEIKLRQKEAWPGNYPITVLDEALQKVSPHFLQPNARSLSAAYPKISKRNQLEKLVMDIGIGEVKFAHLRKAGFPPPIYGGLRCARFLDQSPPD